MNEILSPEEIEADIRAIEAKRKSLEEEKIRLENLENLKFEKEELIEELLTLEK